MGPPIEMRSRVTSSTPHSLPETARAAAADGRKGAMKSETAAVRQSSCSVDRQARAAETEMPGRDARSAAPTPSLLPAPIAGLRAIKLRS